MANTAITDAEARGFVELLEENKSIKNLNVESNFLSGDLLAKMLRAMLKNQTVVEFHADNQVWNLAFSFGFWVRYGLALGLG